MDKEYMLTTIDNPFNPFINYDEWYAFDTSHGYYTCAYLARLVITSDELSEVDQDLAIDKAVNEILLYNIFGKFIKIYKDGHKSLK